MTHPPDAVARVLALHGEGRTATEIATTVHVPRRTVADWLAGRTPHRATTDLTPWTVPQGAEGAYVHLLGLYLGDGCLSAHPRGVYKLRITLDAVYPGIIEECTASMRAVIGTSVRGWPRPYNDVEVYAYSKRWPQVFPQHGPGKKHERPIALERWQTDLILQDPRWLLRGLIQSDGCRFLNTGRNWCHARYSFFNYSDDIRAIFCHACDLLGVRWTTAPRTVYVSRKADVALLDEFIGPKS